MSARDVGLERSPWECRHEEAMCAGARSDVVADGVSEGGTTRSASPRSGASTANSAGQGSSGTDTAAPTAALLAAGKAAWAPNTPRPAPPALMLPVLSGKDEAPTTPAVAAGSAATPLADAASGWPALPLFDESPAAMGFGRHFFGDPRRSPVAASGAFGQNRRLYLDDAMDSADEFTASTSVGRLAPEACPAGRTPSNQRWPALSPSAFTKHGPLGSIVQNTFIHAPLPPPTPLRLGAARRAKSLPKDVGSGREEWEAQCHALSFLRHGVSGASGAAAGVHQQGARGPADLGGGPAYVPPSPSLAASPTCWPISPALTASPGDPARVGMTPAQAVSSAAMMAAVVASQGQLHAMQAHPCHVLRLEDHL